MEHYLHRFAHSAGPGAERRRGGRRGGGQEQKRKLNVLIFVWGCGNSALRGAWEKYLRKVEKMLPGGPKTDPRRAKMRPGRVRNRLPEASGSLSGATSVQVGAGRRRAEAKKLCWKFLEGPKRGKTKACCPPRQKREAKMAPKRPPGEAPGGIFGVVFGTPRRGGISRRKCVENAYFFDFPKAGKNTFFLDM